MKAVATIMKSGWFVTALAYLVMIFLIIWLTVKLYELVVRGFFPAGLQEKLLRDYDDLKEGK